MDAVELPYPVDFAATSKLMGSEGYGRDGVTMKELEACESDRVSAIVNPSSECCSSFLGDKAVARAINASEFPSWDKIPRPEPCKQEIQLPLNQGEALSGIFHDSGKNGILLTPKTEGLQLERKAGKVSRSGSLYPKRPRVVQLQDPITQAGVDGIKDASHKLQKTHVVKQKNNFCGKRGDKRSLRVPSKTKYDSSSVKSGLTNFASGAGGNNFLGAYGLKSDNHDVTKHLDDLSLDKLLDGNYQCPSLGKDKGKKAANLNESFLPSIRKACSILQPFPRTVLPENIAEMDSCSNKKMSQWLLSSISNEASGVNCDTRESSVIDVPSSNEVSCMKPETPANPLNLQLHQPKEILQRLALPPPKDLDSLLLDAAKTSSSSKNIPESRSGKQISRRVNLPPFPWSHSSSGSGRNCSDAVKLSTTRSTCEGRWVKVGKNFTSSPGSATSNFMDLELLAYDHSLVPPGLKTSSNNKISPNITLNPNKRERDSSALTCSKGPGGKGNHPRNAGHCPKLLVAAQTLCDMATRTLRPNQDRMGWPKKSSQKVMKARKLKPNEKTEEAHVTAVAAVARCSNLARSDDQIIPSKKPRLSNNHNNKKDLNGIRKEVFNWSSTLKSSRSSPSKTLKDYIADARHSTSNVVKQSSLMPPPPARVSENASSNLQKLRKSMTIEWNRGRDRLS
ncbi:hypothetical protein UlMin_002032 [Ulmus minor]